MQTLENYFESRFIIGKGVDYTRAYPYSFIRKIQKKYDELTEKRNARIAAQTN